MAKINRKLMGVPTTELADTIRFLADESKKTPNETYKQQCAEKMAELAAELERREEGGKELEDIRTPYVSDGEHLAAGQEPPTNNL